MNLLYVKDKYVYVVSYLADDKMTRIGWSTGSSFNEAEGELRVV